MLMNVSQGLEGLKAFLVYLLDFKKQSFMKVILMCLVLGASLIWHPACPTAQGTDSYLHTLIILASTCIDSKVAYTCAQLFFYLLLYAHCLGIRQYLTLAAYNWGESWCRGKIMSQRANKLQTPFLANSIYCSDPILKMSKTAARHE